MSGMESGIEGFDPALFGLWPAAPVYDGLAAGGGDGAGWSAEECRSQAAAVLLETKSTAPPLEDLRLLLNDMTREMREQFDYFRRLRSLAEQLGSDADEAAAKLARADVKAATDAMSLIVRTLEKVDALQRQLARDRELEAERNADAMGYEAKKRKLLDLIEQRVNERVGAILEQRQRAPALPDDPGPGGAGAATGPPDGDG